jgi:hypothetical protein
VRIYVLAHREYKIILTARKNLQGKRGCIDSEEAEENRGNIEREDAEDGGLTGCRNEFELDSFKELINKGQIFSSIVTIFF